MSIKSLKLSLVISLWSFITFCNNSLASSYYEIQVVSGTDFYHKSIESVAKDSRGFIWFVAGNLLYRYDGVSIRSFSELYKGEHYFTEVNRIMADREGRLWLSTRNGLLIFDTLKWAFLNNTHIAKNLWKDDVIDMFDDGESQFIATKSGLLWQIQGQKKRIRLRFDPSNKELRPIAGKRLISDGNVLWFIFDEQVFRIDLKSNKVIKAQIPNDFYEKIEDIFLLQQGLLLRNFAHGYLTFDGHTFKSIIPSGLSKGDVMNWAHWSFADKNRIVFMYNDGRYFEYKDNLSLTPLVANRHYINPDLLKSKLNHYYFDKSEGLFATEKGLYSILNANFEVQYWNTGTARGILKQKDQFYIGGYAPLKSFAPKDTVIKSVAPLNNYYIMLPINRDTALVGLEGDFLGLLINGKFKKLPSIPKDDKGMSLSLSAFSMCHYQGRKYLIGTYSGIWIYDIDTHIVMPLRDKDGNAIGSGQRISALHCDKLHISFSSEDGYFECNNGLLHKVYPINGEKLNIFTHTIQGNNVYLATKGKGLIVLNRKTKSIKSYTSNDGVANNVIFSMKWVKGKLFLGTFSGLSVWDGKQFYNASHIHGLPFEEFNQPSVYYDDEQDLLLMGGVTGCIGIHPESFLKSLKELRVPVPILSSTFVGKSRDDIVSNYSPTQLGDTIFLDKEAVFVKLNFARPDAYKNNFKTYFRIRQLNKSFQELTASGDIDLFDLKTGEYEVEVKNVSVNGRSVNTRRWLLFKNPRFYETQFFYFLIAILTGTVIYLVTILKSAQIKRDKKLRMELSKNLHDEVGGLLTGIAMQTDLIAMGRQKTDMDRSIRQISDYSREAVQTMDDIIWAIDPRNNNEESLEDRMKFLASQLLGSQGIELIFRTETGSHRQLPQYVRQNVYLIFKEALHNICKHGTKATVAIFLLIDHDKIDLKITNPLSSGQTDNIIFTTLRKGQGMGNMERRAEAIDGKLLITRSTAAYTVHLVVKYKFAKFFSDLF